MNWKTYQEGFDAWDEHIKTGINPGNPYPVDTDEWGSWNQGWNSNINGVVIEINPEDFL